MKIQPYNTEQLDAVIGVALRAWDPVFDSIQQMLSADIYRTFYPEDWQVSQQKAVEKACLAEDTSVWVAKVFDPPDINEAGVIVGFVAVKLDSAEQMGEIHMIAVDPEYQAQGIGSALIAFALDWMKGAGMAIAMVETGGDPGHAPARHTYEKAGFERFPVARYFKML